MQIKKEKYSFHLSYDIENETVNEDKVYLDKQKTLYCIIKKSFPNEIFFPVKSTIILTYYEYPVDLLDYLRFCLTQPNNNYYQYFISLIAWDDKGQDILDTVFDKQYSTDRYAEYHKTQCDNTGYDIKNYKGFKVTLV